MLRYFRFHAATFVSAFILTTVALAADTTITGELRVRYADDFENGVSEKLYAIIDEDTGRAYEVLFEQLPGKKHTSGAIVRARGKLNGDQFLVQGNGDGSVETVAAASTATGLRRVAVILINMNDANLECSNAFVTDLMYGGTDSVAGYYDEASYGLTGIDGDADGDGVYDVFGPVTIDYSITGSCFYAGWAFDAKTQAQQQFGLDLGLYTNFIYVLPSSVPCSWAGLGDLGCSTGCEAWVKACQWPDIYEHELGHNYGMHHSTIDANNDGAYENVYGDLGCVMGYSNVGHRHPNAAHKEEMGWFADYPEQIDVVQQAGQYTIDALTALPWQAANPQVLKLPAANGGHYYLSYRVRQGYDSSIRSAYVGGVSIHKFSGITSSFTYYIDTLANGGTFSDPASGFTITQLSHSPDPATGSVTLSISMECTAAQHTALMYSNGSAQSLPGGTINYTVSVTNHDAGGCAPAEFALLPNVPAGWSSSLTNSTLTISAGQTATTTLSVQSDASASPGVYPVSVTVVDLSSHRADVTPSFSYEVLSGEPDAVTDLTASVQKKTRIKLDWTAAPDNTGGTVGTYNIFRDAGTGFAQVATINGTSYTDNDTASGNTYQYYVVGIASNGLESDPSNTVSVTTGGGGGGKPGGGGGGNGGGRGGPKK